MTAKVGLNICGACISSIFLYPTDIGISHTRALMQPFDDSVFDQCELHHTELGSAFSIKLFFACEGAVSSVLLKLGLQIQRKSSATGM